jgi:hypothetical protein
MTILEPMPPERFDEFAEVAIASHAADNVALGRWLEHEARYLAREELGRLLPQQSKRGSKALLTIRARSRRASC